MRPTTPVNAAVAAPADTPEPRSTRRRPAALLLTGCFALIALLTANGAPSAFAAVTPIGMGTLTSYAVLAGSTVANTGVSNISGDLGVSPGSAVVGFPPGIVTNGVIHAGDASAAQAQLDLVTAYDTAAGESPQTPVGPDLAGQTLVAGIYGNSDAAGTLGLTGTVTLDGQNNPDGLFVFQADSTLITGSSATVRLINGASPCNVYWKVGSSATLGTGTEFVGNILALTSISLTTDANVQGRVLARNGAVTLDSNNITAPSCTAVTGGTGGAGGTGGTGTDGTGGTGGTGTDATGSGTGPQPGSTPDLTTGSVVPPGHPETGLGGTGSSPDGRFLVLGGLALAGAVLVAARPRPRRQATTPTGT